MEFFPQALAKLVLVPALLAGLAACSSLESSTPETRLATEPVTTPAPALVTSATPSTETFAPTTTPVATALPTGTATPAATLAGPGATPTDLPPDTTVIDEYYNLAAAALGFADLGTPPPLPAVPSAFLLPTIVPEQILDLAIPPRQIWRADKTRPRIALTFDTGQGTPIVRIILDELRQANVRATFFLVGNWAKKNEDVVRTIVADKHDLANHSYSHPNFDNLTDDQMLAQMITTEDIIHQETGCTTRPFFRAPFGAASTHTLQVIAQAGFMNFMWTVHGGDWLPGATTETIHQRVVQNTSNGAIIILHSSVPATAQAVPLIVADLRARGFEFVTLSDLLSTDPAHPFRAPCKAI